MFIGYDKIAERMAQLADLSMKAVHNYPPFNIKKIDKNNYAIELAVAGFAKQNLSVKLENGTLKIKGKIESTDNDNFLFKGISTKAFCRSFAITDSMEVKNAELVNGLLRVFLESISPEKTVEEVEIKEG